MARGSSREPREEPEGGSGGPGRGKRVRRDLPSFSRSPGAPGLPSSSSLGSSLGSLRLTEQDKEKTAAFNESAAEFVPGKPWSSGQSPAEVPKKSLRTEARGSLTEQEFLDMFVRPGEGKEPEGAPRKAFGALLGF